MSHWGIGMRHIVDVDGQLLAIDADVIDATALLARANRPLDRQLWELRAGEYFAVESRQLIRLSEDQVMFFETTAVPHLAVAHRLAA